MTILEILTMLSIGSGIISTMIVILRSTGLFKGISSLKPEQIDKCCDEFLKINPYPEKEEIVNRIKEQAYCNHLFGIMSTPSKIKILSICQRNKVSPYITRAITMFMTIEDNELKIKNKIDIAAYVYLACSYFLVGLAFLMLGFIASNSIELKGTLLIILSTIMLALSVAYLFEFNVFLFSKKKVKIASDLINSRLKEIS